MATGGRIGGISAPSRDQIGRDLEEAVQRDLAQRGPTGRREPEEAVERHLAQQDLSMQEEPADPGQGYDISKYANPEDIPPEVFRRMPVAVARDLCNKRISDLTGEGNHIKTALSNEQGRLNLMKQQAEELENMCVALDDQKSEMQTVADRLRAIAKRRHRANPEETACRMNLLAQSVHEAQNHNAALDKKLADLLAVVQDKNRLQDEAAYERSVIQQDMNENNKNCNSILQEIAQCQGPVKSQDQQLAQLKAEIVDFAGVHAATAFEGAVQRQHLNTLIAQTEKLLKRPAEAQKKFRRLSKKKEEDIQRMIKEDQELSEHIKTLETSV